MKIRQLVYHSHAVGSVKSTDILEQSRHNNALDGITGILWFDGSEFVQVIEGSDHSVAAAFTRIAADPRHRDISVLGDRVLDEREFGYWSMELGTTAAGNEAAARLKRRIAKLPLELQVHFFRNAE